MRSQFIPNRLRRHRFAAAAVPGATAKDPSPANQGGLSQNLGGRRDVNDGASCVQPAEARSFVNDIIQNKNVEHDAAENMLLLSQKGTQAAENPKPDSNLSSDKAAPEDQSNKRQRRAQSASLRITATNASEDDQLVLGQRLLIQEIIHNFPTASSLSNETLIKRLTSLPKLYTCQAKRGSSFQREVECLSRGDPTRFAIDYSKRSKSDFSSVCVHGVVTRMRFRKTHLYAIACVSPEVEPGPQYACFTLEEDVLNVVRNKGFQRSATLAVKIAVDAHLAASNLANEEHIIYPQKNEIFLNSYEPFLRMVFANSDRTLVQKRLEAERRRCESTVPITVLDALEGLIMKPEHNVLDSSMPSASLESQDSAVIITLD